MLTDPSYKPLVLTELSIWYSYSCQINYIFPKLVYQLLSLTLVHMGVSLKDSACLEWLFICFHLLRYLYLFNSTIAFSRNFSQKKTDPWEQPTPLDVSMSLDNIFSSQITIICYYIPEMDKTDCEGHKYKMPYTPSVDLVIVY